jgi:MerR family transcriptional regulator, copper efflux regulator
LNIGQASETSGISAKMIRYYESIGLVPKADRTDGGYRDYGPADVHRLRFIRRSRDLGFSFDQVRALLKLWSDKNRSSADVKALAQAHIGELEMRAAGLKEMIRTLRQLANSCNGSNRPDCPIIEELQSGALSCKATRIAPRSGGTRDANKRNKRNKAATSKLIR